MKYAFVILFSMLQFLQIGFAQNQDSEIDYTHLGLPDGAVARLGYGTNGTVKFSPDDTRVAIPNSFGFRLYDAQTHDEIALLTGHTKRVGCVAFSPNGKTLASGSADTTIRLWDTKTGQLITTLEEYDPDAPIAFSPDGQTFASGGENAKILLWDLNTGKLKTTFTAYNPVRRISFEEDGKTLTTSGSDGTKLLWDLKGIDK